MHWWWKHRNRAYFGHVCTHPGSTEYVGPENGRPKKMKHLKMQDLKMQDLKMQDQMSPHENAGLENEGPKKQNRNMQELGPVG